MPEMVASPTANHIAVHALSAMGKGDTEIAHTLGMDRATAWRMRHKELLDPSLIQHASKTIADKMLLSATAAVDTFLDKAEAGELVKEQPGRLIKMAATAMESAASYAALSGGKEMIGNMMAEYGIAGSHSASRITLESKVTVESATVARQPVDISVSADPQLGAEPASTGRTRQPPAGRGAIPPGGAKRVA